VFTPLVLAAALLAAAPREPAPREPAPDDDSVALVAAVRALAVQQLYQTHLNLDTVIELRFFGAREPGELNRMLVTAIDSAEEAERHLARVAKLKGLGKEDAAAVERLRKIAVQLRTQGVALQAYWTTGVADHWKDSETARKAAWKELEDLMELKKGVAPPPREPGKKKP
jgi:hypothetical protein